MAVLAACAPCEAAPAGVPAPAAPTRPDVLIVVIDTLRPDHLEAYGCSPPTSPFLREVAEAGAVFDDAVSTSSWTAPSVASIVTGLYPTRHGVTQGFHAHDREMADVLRAGGTPTRVNRLRDGDATIAERLAAHGYRTLGVATNINVGPEIGTSRGIERFVGIDFRRGRRPSDDSLWYGPAEDVVAAVEELRAELAEPGPYLLYLHFNDPHEPYRLRGDPMPGASADAEIAAYDTEIRHVDAALRRIVSSLERPPLLFVLSDHGEAFGEHGYRRHPAALHRELNRVAFLARGPGIRAGRHAARVSLVDVLPTVMALAVGVAPGDVDGLSLAPLMRGEAATSLARRLASRPLFAHRRVDGERALEAVFLGRRQLIVGPDGASLFDLVDDPGQRTDLAAAAPREVERLTTTLEAHRRAHAAAPEHVDVPLSEDDLARLRALGYAE